MIVFISPPGIWVFKLFCGTALAYQEECQLIYVSLQVAIILVLLPSRMRERNVFPRVIHDKSSLIPFSPGPFLVE
jgi:hypothetical protein